jgi:hypothetical protein
MDTATCDKESSYFKKIDGHWVPVNLNGSIEGNRSTNSISTRRRYLSYGGKKIIFY